MPLPMDGGKAFFLHMGINFRGRDVQMTEQHLDGTQVRPAFQQMGGEGVPKGVRRNGGAHAGFQGVAFDALPHGHAGKPLAGAVQKQDRLFGAEERPPMGQIIA